jgi:signal transduction histidine kinase/ligand-binding sensor domain-containing protein
MKRNHPNLPAILLCESNCFTWRHAFLLAFFLFIFFIGQSQRQPIKFEYIGTSLGLSQSNVICILQDSRGFMWFGTRDGLNKYDGYKFTVYKNDISDSASISHNTVQDITEDKDGNIWIATWGGGLNKFDRRKEKFIRQKFSLRNFSGIRKDYINKLFFDSEGKLWIGTENDGLYTLDIKTSSIQHFTHDEINSSSLSSNQVKDIVEDGRHNLWFGTGGGGVEMYDRQTKSFRHFRHDPMDSTSIASDDDWELFIDSKDRLWIGTRGEGMEQFDRTNEEFIHYRNVSGNTNIIQSNVIKVINEDERGNLWIGTENGGLSVLNNETNSFDNYTRDDADNTSINNNSIWSILRDAKGSMWIGTASGGINVVNRDAGKFIHHRHTSSPLSLSNNSVLSIFEDSDMNLWVGTDGGGVNLFNRSSGTFTHILHDPKNPNSLGGNHILDIIEDSEKNLWIGTWAAGVTVYNRLKNTFRHYKYDPVNPNGISSPNIWTVFEDSHKNIWLGTYSAGISRYDPAKDGFIHYRSDAGNAASLGNNTVNFFFEDSKKNLWVGTNGSGLDLFDKLNQNFIHHAHDDNRNSISNDNIYCVAEDRDGNLWIGTDLGLNRMDKDGHFTSYFMKDGLPSNTITGILIDKKGILWVSTFNGMSRFNPITKTFVNFGTNDGLQSREFKMNSCFMSRSGKMYFGGINGFNEFIPDELREKKFDPPLVFTDFQAFNKQVPISEDKNSILKQSIADTRELVLPYSQSVISFEFAALNYTAAEKKQYAYILDGFDSDWNYIGTRHAATYTNLNPGVYTLRVRKLNNEGNWSVSTATLKLTITPPYWMTWWFRVGIIVLVAGTVVLFYRFRVRAIKGQRAKLQKLVHEQTRQLIQSSQEEHKARQDAEIARMEAEQANIELERKNKELEQFAYVASHDMQEPLRTTTSYVELLQKQYKGMLDPKADKYLSYISQSSDRMKVLIKDLLDFSRIGKKGSLEKTDCNTVVKAVLADLTVAISESEANITTQNLPVICAYPTEIKQLFQNLLINAIKFRKPGVPPQIRICVQKTKNGWEFVVRDNGIGIDKKHNDKIFVIFQRLHNRTEYEGSGIGLAHCKKIVELHGGEIWIESSPGEGSAFHFTIPNEEDD